MEITPDEELSCEDIASRLRDIADETEKSDGETFYERPYKSLDELYHILRAKGIFKGHFIEH